jgi:purine-binding chemotaxis protein CheW
MAEDPPEQRGRTLYGVIVLGGQTVAIDIEAIREVVPCPPRLLPFPATQAAVAGAIDLRGTLVPVLDPVRLPGFPAGPGTPPGIVTILRHQGRMFGVLTHAILGVADLGRMGETPALRPLGVNPGLGAAPLLAASFLHRDWQGVVIDAAALATLPGLPHTPDSQQGHAGTPRDSLPTLMFVAGAVAMAITAALVDATLPDAPVAPPPMEDPLWIGMLPYKGRDIALVDTLALTGFAPTPRPVTHGAAVVLRYPAADGTLDHVALLISSVHDIAGLSPEALLPMTDTQIAGATMTDALFHARGRAHMRLSEEALLAHPALTALAALRQTSARAQARGQRDKEAQRPWLIFTVGQAALATALDDVEEIIRADIEMLPMPHGGRALRGLAIHRGASVPLVDLGERLGLAEDRVGPRAFILMSRAGERRQGFLVDSLRSVERAAASALRADGAQSGPSIPAATVRIDAVTTCEVIDLPGLIAA